MKPVHLFAILWLSLSATQAACPPAVTACEDFEGRTAAAPDRPVGTVMPLPNGDAAPAATASHALALTANDGAFLLPAPTPLARPYYVQARVRPVAGAGQGVVLASYVDARNWLGVRVGIRPDSLRLDVDLVAMHNGELKRLRQGDADLDAAGSLYTVRIAVGPAAVTSYVNGNPIHSADDAGPFAAVGHSGVLAAAGSVLFDDLRTGSAEVAPVRLALAGSSTRITLQARDPAQRYPVRVLAPAGATIPLLHAISSAPAVATATMTGDTLVVQAHAAGDAILSVGDRNDSSVAISIGVRVEPPFAPPSPAGQLALGAAASPLPGAADVPVDTVLALTFDRPPVLSGTGSVRIFRASDGALVDVLRVTNEVNQIGAAADGYRRVVRFEPVAVRGNTLSIRPHDGRLAYDTAYYVLLDSALLDDAQLASQPFAGIGSRASWQFRTRARPPGRTALHVSPTGAADFRTLQGALNHVMRHVARATPVTITVGDGEYDDLLYLRGKDHVTIRGASRDGARIVSRNGNGLNPGAGGGQGAAAPGITGGRSVFLIEDADLVHIDNLSITNTMPRASVLGGQAEVLHFAGGGRLAVTNASLTSEQDTVLVRGYAWFYRSLIAGNVDFIWGYSPAALFEDSEIRSVGDTAGTRNGGYIVQARTVHRDDPGFVFLNSRITHGPGPAGNDVPAGSSYLARPGARTTWDNVVFVNCRIDRHIAAQGWYGQPREGRGWGEFNSMGPHGAPLDLAARTGGAAITAADAARYASRQRVFAGFDGGRGWDPSSLIP